MAIFNPDQNPINPDYTGDSKGFKANTAGADLFGAAGELGMAAIKIKDQSNVNKIQQEVYKEIDQLNDEWGTNASSFETNVSNPNNTQPLPSDLERYGRHLQDVRKAYINGTLKESNYQMRIDSMSRQIRARFPGYRDAIDGIISKTLGQSTANDVRRSLMAQWAAESNQQDDAVKRFESEVTQARKDGALPPDYDARMAAGNPYSVGETRVYMASKYSLKAQREEEIQKYNLMDKSKDSSIKTLITIAQNNVSDAVNRVWEGAYAVPGANLSGRELQDGIASGRFKPPSGTELATLKANFDVMFSKVQTELNTMMTNPLYADLSPTQKKEIVDQGMANMNVLKEAIYNGQWGLVNSSKTINDATLQNDLYAFGQNPDVRAATLAKAWSNGSAVFDSLLLQNPEMASKINKALLSITTGELFNGEAKSLNEVIKGANDKVTGGLEPEVVKQTIHNSVKMLLDKNAGPDVAMQAAKLLFSEENQNFLGEFSDKSIDGRKPSSQWQVFDALVSPRMTERMTELSKTDPQVYENYRNWVLNSFQALFNQDISSLTDLNKYGDTIQFRYDPETAQFKAEPNVQGQQRNLPAVQQLYNEWSTSTAMKSMNNLNKYMKQLKPIMEADGNNAEEALTALLDRFQVNSLKNEGSLFARLYEAIGSKVGSGRFFTKEAIEKRLMNNPFDQELQGFNLDKSGSGKMADSRPRGIRNNNPGNIEFGDFAKDQGASGSDGRFAQFDSPEKGIKAMRTLLENYQKKGMDTVSSMINRWSPNTENDTEGYAKAVAKEMGIDPDEPFLFTGELADRMIHAMIRHENGVNPYEQAAK